VVFPGRTCGLYLLRDMKAIATGQLGESEARVKNPKEQTNCPARQMRGKKAAAPQNIVFATVGEMSELPVSFTGGTAGCHRRDILIVIGVQDGSRVSAKRYGRLLQIG